MKSANANNSGCSVLFLLVWLIGWSAGTLLFDSMAVWGIAKQLHSLSYLQVPGLVTKSEMRVTHDSEDGDSYHLDLEYSYEVDGIGYTSDRRQYGFSSGGRSDVKRMAEEYAIGNSIDVYHNPADPADSVVVLGISALDLFLPLFLIPFNMIMIGIFSYTVGARVRGWFSKRPVTIRVWQRDVIWFAKVYNFLPIVSAGVTALATSFILIFIVGFGQILLSGWILIIPAWCIVIFGSLFAWLKTKPTVRLEIDEYHQRLTLQFPGQPEPDVIDITSIQSVDARDKTVVLNTDSAPIKLPCSSDTDAQWLREWLRERFGSS